MQTDIVVTANTSAQVCSSTSAHPRSRAAELVPEDPEQAIGIGLSVTIAGRQLRPDHSPCVALIGATRSNWHTQPKSRFSRHAGGSIGYSSS